MTNPQNVEAKAKQKLTAMSRWNSQTEAFVKAILSAITVNTKPDAITLGEWANVMSILNKSTISTTGELAKENDVADAVVVITIRLDNDKEATDKKAAEKAASEAALLKFMDSVHAILKASVEGHTELGVQKYEGERKTYVLNVMKALYDGKDISAMLASNVPGVTDNQYYVNVKNNVMNAWQNKNVTYFAELMDSQLMYKYPFKSYASGTGTTEVIELKIKVGNIGPGKKTFFSMLDNLTKQTYGWQIDGKDVDQATFTNEYNLWKEAAKATSTPGGVIETKAENAVDSVTGALNDPFGINALIKSLLGALITITIFVCVFAAIIFAGWMLYKHFKKPKPAQQAASEAGMPYVGAYAEGGVVPATGMAVVHQGERVVPSDVAAEEGFFKGRAALGKGVYWAEEANRNIMSGGTYGAARLAAYLALKKDPTQSKQSTRNLVRIAKGYAHGIDVAQGYIPVVGQYVSGGEKLLGVQDARAQHYKEQQLELDPRYQAMVEGGIQIGAQAYKTGGKEAVIGGAQKIKGKYYDLKKGPNEPDADFIARLSAHNEAKENLTVAQQKAAPVVNAAVSKEIGMPVKVVPVPDATLRQQIDSGAYVPMNEEEIEATADLQDAQIKALEHKEGLMNASEHHNDINMMAEQIKDARTPDELEGLKRGLARKQLKVMQSLPPGKTTDAMRRLGEIARDNPQAIADYNEKYGGNIVVQELDDKDNPTITAADARDDALVAEAQEKADADYAAKVEADVEKDKVERLVADARIKSLKNTNERLQKDIKVLTAPVTKLTKQDDDAWTKVKVAHFKKKKV